MGKLIADVAIVGAGPVGLHAALKAALLNHSVVVLDGAQRYSRAFFVPRVANLPGIEPISGRELMRRQRAALAAYKKVQIFDYTQVTELIPSRDGFQLRCNMIMDKVVVGSTQYSSRCVILATGVNDRQVEINGSIRSVLPYANTGIVVYCVLCDGHTLIDKETVVIGYTYDAVWVAVHAARFAKSVTLVTHNKELFQGEHLSVERGRKTLDTMRSSGIDVVQAEIKELFGIERNIIGMRFEDGVQREFEKAVMALGFYRVKNELPLQIGAHVDTHGFIIVDDDCRVHRKNGRAIPGLYAVGDITSNWKQIPVGWGDAEKAVLHAHMNRLW